MAPTVITPAHEAGVFDDASALLLPAATMMVVPREIAPLIASCVADVEKHEPEPPRLMLMISAGSGLLGTPAVSHCFGASSLPDPRLWPCQARRL